MMTPSTLTIPATYTDTGERCIVTVTADEWNVRTFAVGERIVCHLSPNHCGDGRRLIKAEVSGAFGGF